MGSSTSCASSEAVRYCSAMTRAQLAHRCMRLPLRWACSQAEAAAGGFLAAAAAVSPSNLSMLPSSVLSRQARLPVLGCGLLHACSSNRPDSALITP